MALITPFKQDDSVDYTALLRMVDYLVLNNVDFLCVLGTTAETPTLTDYEKEKVKETVIERVNGRVPILLGVGGNNTRGVTDGSVQTAAAAKKYPCSTEPVSACQSR